MGEENIETKDESKKENVLSKNRSVFGSKLSNKTKGILGALLAVAFIFSMFGGFDFIFGNSPVDNTQSQAKQTIPSLSESVKTLSTDGIKVFSEIQDSAIAQDGKQVSLVVIVDYGTSKARAEEIGESFVLIVEKYNGSGGIYDYLITVAYPDQTKIAMGAKVSFSPVVTW